LLEQSESIIRTEDTRTRCAPVLDDVEPPVAPPAEPLVDPAAVEPVDEAEPVEELLPLVPVDEPVADEPPPAPERELLSSVPVTSTR